MAESTTMNGDRRVAIVKGLRTPFVKAGTVFSNLTALDLGRMVVQELVQRAELDPKEIDQVVFGQVIPNLTATSIAREVVIAAGLPKTIEAHTVVRACATSIQALTDAANSIALGQSDAALVGGTESISDVPIFASRPLAQALAASSRGKNLGAKLRSFQKLKPRDLLPHPPAIEEYSTGLTMGESAEKMAKENGISRAEQDQLALRSHQNAAAAWKEGKFEDQVMHVLIPPKYEQVVAKDNIVREDSTLEALSALKPVFDRAYGTITAGNSSPLTDGAAALLVMSAKRARELGYEPLGYLRAFAYAATDPNDQLLQGPAYAAPVASNLQAFASIEFARKMGRSEPLGEVDRSRLNVTGGSIALGHPSGATGARVVAQALSELKRRGKNTALCTVCAAGGLGAAVVLERV